MTEMTYVDPNDIAKFTDASKLQKGDYVFDGKGNELYLVLNKDYTSSGLICRDLQTGLKSTINPQGIQHYIGTEGWYCGRLGDAAKGVKISEADEQAIAETLRIAGVQLDEAISDDKKYITREEVNPLIDYLKSNKIIKKYITKNSWTSGSQTEVYPMSLWKDGLSIQLDTDKNYFEDIINDVKNKFNFVTSAYFTKSDGSRPSELNFYFTNDGEWFFKK